MHAGSPTPPRRAPTRSTSDGPTRWHPEPELRSRSDKIGDAPNERSAFRSVTTRCRRVVRTDQPVQRAHAGISRSDPTRWRRPAGELPGQSGQATRRGRACESGPHRATSDSPRTGGEGGAGGGRRPGRRTTRNRWPPRCRGWIRTFTDDDQPAARTAEGGNDLCCAIDASNCGSHRGRLSKEHDDEVRRTQPAVRLGRPTAIGEGDHIAE